MEKQKALSLSQRLLDAEFDEFSQSPFAYCVSMGWTPGSDAVIRAIERVDLYPTKDDYNNLASIIESINSEDSLEILESNSVSDFLVNCVAKHIFQEA